jgi:DNA-directed RNA polymerase specialized sigma24 family protein
MMQAVARSFRLAPTDVDDAVQTTWARAFSTAASVAGARGDRRLARRHGAPRVTALLQRARPKILTDEPPEADRGEVEQPESAVLEVERREALHAAVRRLPAHQRRLLNALLATPWSSYDELSPALGMPVGSIGPARAAASAACAATPRSWR